MLCPLWQSGGTWSQGVGILLLHPPLQGVPTEVYITRYRYFLLLSRSHEPYDYT